MPGMLRSAGIQLVTLAEHYGVPADEQVRDVEWLQLSGEMGWPVLMKDERIRRRPEERAVLKRYQVRAFCLASANLSSRDMATTFLTWWSEIESFSSSPGPYVYSVSRSGLRQIL